MFRMKVGDIVRRKTSQNKMIGPYMKVEAITGDHVYAQAYNLDEPNVSLLKRNVQACPMTSLAVAENMINRLKCGECTSVSHPATKRWRDFVNKSLSDKNNLVVRFYCVPRGYYVYFKVENAYLKQSLGESVVKIIIGQRIG